MTAQQDSASFSSEKPEAAAQPNLPMSMDQLLGMLGLWDRRDKTCVLVTDLKLSQGMVVIAILHSNENVRNPKKSLDHIKA